jgi:hypothetical protein
MDGLTFKISFGAQTPTDVMSVPSPVARPWVVEKGRPAGETTSSIPIQEMIGGNPASNSIISRSI